MVVTLNRFSCYYQVGFTFHPDDTFRFKELIGQNRYALDVCDMAGTTVAKYRVDWLQLGGDRSNLVAGQRMRALLKFKWDTASA